MTHHLAETIYAHLAATKGVPVVSHVTSSYVSRTMDHGNREVLGALDQAKTQFRMAHFGNYHVHGFVTSFGGQLNEKK